PPDRRNPARTTRWTFGRACSTMRRWLKPYAGSTHENRRFRPWSDGRDRGRVPAQPAAGAAAPAGERPARTRKRSAPGRHPREGPQGRTAPVLAGGNGTTAEPQRPRRVLP